MRIIIEVEGILYEMVESSVNCKDCTFEGEHTCAILNNCGNFKRILDIKNMKWEVLK